VVGAVAAESEPAARRKAKKESFMKIPLAMGLKTMELISVWPRA